MTWRGCGLCHQPAMHPRHSGPLPSFPVSLPLFRRRRESPPSFPQRAPRHPGPLPSFPHSRPPFHTAQIPAYAGMTGWGAENDGMMKELVNDVSIVIVTHNMQQAARQADRSATTMTRLTPSTIKSTMSP